MKRKLFYCLNGTGYFGRRSLRSIVELRPYLATKDIEIELLAVADPIERNREEIRKSLLALQFSAEGVGFAANIEELLRFIRLHADRYVHDGHSYLIHDCSPTLVHYGNIINFNRVLRQSEFARKNVRLLVEKPALTTDQYRRFALRPDYLVNCYCDYIELESRTYLAAKEWLDKNDFVPKRVFVWRNSGTGFKRVLARDRQGVAGGALEDKAAHDIALTIGFFGQPIEKPAVKNASILSLLPYSTDSQVPAFYNTDDSVAQSLDRRYTASHEAERNKLSFSIGDARIRAHVDWPSQIGGIDVTYHFSWDGVDEELNRIMEWCNLPWKGTATASAKGQSYKINEARIWIIEGHDGRKLILNFLAKYKIDPWALVLEGDRIISLDLPEVFGGDNSLARILLSAASEDCEILGRDTTRQIAELCYEIRAAATDRAWHCDEVTAMDETVNNFLLRSSSRDIPRLVGLVIDLDNTLIQTESLPASFVDGIIKEINRAGEIDPDRLNLLRTRLMYRNLRDVKAEFGLSREQFRSAIEYIRANAEVAASGVRLFEDGMEFLRKARRLGLQCALLTSGIRELQEAKLRAAGLMDFFEDSIYIDDVSIGSAGIGKKEFLSAIRTLWACDASQILVVGDDHEAELRAGLELAMGTVHVRRNSDSLAGTHPSVQSLAEIDLDKLARTSRI